MVRIVELANVNRDRLPIQQSLVTVHDHLIKEFCFTACTLSDALKFSSNNLFF